MSGVSLRTQLTRMVSATQGLVTDAQVASIGEDPNNRRGNIVALKRILETSDFYELAERVYTSWERSQKLEKLAEALHIAEQLKVRLKARSFHQWLRVRDFSDLDATFQKLKGYTLRLLKENKALTASLPKKIIIETTQTKAPAHVYSQSAAIRREIADMSERLPLSGSVHSSAASLPDNPPKIHDRLYKEAARRELANNQLRMMKEEKERRETPFKPSLSSSGSVPELPVFDRLSSSTPKLTEYDREKIRMEREMQGCTFTPQLISRSRENSISRSSSFERLYEDAETKRQNMRAREKAHQQSVDECTFRPSITPGRGSPSGENVYEKLYASYRSNLRKRQDLEVERSAQQSKECPFTPKLTATPHNRSVDDKREAHERLYQERERHKARLDELKVRVEKEETEKVDRARTAPKKRLEQPSPDRFNRLYEEAARLRDKRAQAAEPPPAKRPVSTTPKLEPPSAKHGDIVKALYQELVSKA